MCLNRRMKAAAKTGIFPPLVKCGFDRVSNTCDAEIENFYNNLIF